MTKQEYAFKYGEGQIRFALDPGLVAGELRIKEYSPIPNAVSAIREAIRKPIQSKPPREIVRSDQTVAFLVNDPPRVANSHVFMPILLEEMKAVGVPDKNMFIMFAAGAHRELTGAEMVEMVGPDVAQRIKMYNTNA